MKHYFEPRYQAELQLKFLVPIALEEHCSQPQKPRDDRLEVTSVLRELPPVSGHDRRTIEPPAPD